MFNAEFFYAKTIYFLAELGLIRRHSEEDLDIYVKRFHDKALDNCDLVNERKS